MNEIGLFFGSFNPIHIGHLSIGEHFQQTQNLDEIWYILSPQNPFKEPEGLIAVEIRQRMIEAVIASKKFAPFRLITHELGQPPPHYSYHTLHYLIEKYPDHNFSLIMGEDNRIALDTWYRGDWIIDHFKILTYPRRGVRGQGKKNFDWEMPIIDISASEIRDRVRKGLPISDWVTYEVEAIIHQEKLYLT